MQPGARWREPGSAAPRAGLARQSVLPSWHPGVPGRGGGRPNGTEAGAGGVAYAERAVSYHHDVGGT